MAGKKIAMLSIVLVGIFVSAIFFWKGYPIVFRTSKTRGAQLHYDSAVFNPLNGLPLDDGEWAAYLLLDKYDFEKLTPELKPYKVWKTSSVSVLKQMQNAWDFKPRGSDIATVTSSLSIIHDGEIVFETEIVLDQDLMGFQSRDFGWAEPVDKEKFAATLKEFRKVRSPFVFI